MKTCYIINFFLGGRRNNVKIFNVDKLCYVKSQIESLQKYKHSISKIIFSFNVEKEHYDLLSDAINIIPKYIQSSEVEINVRENYGMSYGAFSDMFVKYQNQFDYYIFNEDDYVFVQDNFDEYLINKFNSLPNCGYLCGLVRESAFYVNIRHAGMSSGISSYDVLKKVYDKHGELPHSKGVDYESNEKKGQTLQTATIRELGFEIFDIRDDYRLQFWSGDHIHFTDDGIINIHFMWNKNDLLLPSTVYFNDDYRWVDMIEKEFLRMESDYNSKKYFDY